MYYYLIKKYDYLMFIFKFGLRVNQRLCYSLVEPTLDRLCNFVKKIVWSPSGPLNAIRVKCCHLPHPV